jgi:hypothetical protein
MQHFVDIRAADKQLIEYRSDSTPRKNSRWLPADIAGAPNGKGPGVLLFDDFESAKIKSLKADEIVLELAENQTLTLERR